MPLEELDDEDGLDGTFESVRGAVHIVIMGEGISSLSTLYKNYQSNDIILQENDISRTSLCALYFIKKGFPFISILQGGFASSYVYLSRSSLFLTKSSMLIDYDPNTSLVAKLEAAYVEQCIHKIASIKAKNTVKINRVGFSSLKELDYSINKL